jgi:(2R)-sulfolactate sulfo-lyase subunit alpha
VVGRDEGGSGFRILILYPGIEEVRFIVFKFLIHESGDSVGVAVADIGAGELVTGAYLNDHSQTMTIVARDDVPLGHKIALADLPANGKVMKYGVVIGGALAPIAVGEHVHVHNLRSLRWA